MDQWPIRKALCIIGGSLLATLVLCFSAYSIYAHVCLKKKTDMRYNIEAIIQTGPEKQALKTGYLAEILGLSLSHPTNLYALDVKKAEAALLTSPLISSAKVQRMPPKTLYIDYEVRKPIAWLSDYQNIGIDREKILFPMAPFLSPKEMPEIYLGLPSFNEPEDSFGRAGGKWRTPLQNRYITLAFEILTLFEGSAWKEGLKVKRIDVSNAFAPSLGRREIVLFTEEEMLVNNHAFTFPKVLRLSTKDYPHQLQNFFTLRRAMIEDYRKQLMLSNENTHFAPRIVDLRIPQIAFVESGR